ncbi:MAG: hypothetical protein ACOZBH_01485 [Patescibacteria group bacterium]
MLPRFCFAQDIANDLETVGQQAGIQTAESLPVVIGRIIRIVIGFMGVVLLGIIIYAGWLWMTAGGEAEQIEKAKKWMVNGIIGLVIMLFAYSIVTFIINRLTQEGIITQGGPYAGYGQGGGGYGGGALGPGGIIEDHYPERDATNVPRNTFIMVKFYEPLKPETVMFDAAPCAQGSEQLCGAINWSNIRIFESDRAGDDGEPPSAQADLITAGTMTLTADKKTLFFKPAEFLGSANIDVVHTVYLTSGLQKENGSNVFDEYNEYAWIFTTGTYVDETPPQVISVAPRNQQNPAFQFFANSIIQINFNEPVLPPPDTETSGTDADAGKIIRIGFTRDNQLFYVAGTFNTGLNRFRTIEFIPLEDCAGAALNSCGEIPKCLPKGVTVTPYIRSASVQNGLTAFPFDGLVDTAGNSLDGNYDGQSQGPSADDFSWSFETSSVLDLTPPVIDSTEPSNVQGEVAVDAPVIADFNEGLSAASASSRNVFLTGDHWSKWYVVHFENVQAAPDENGQSTTTTNNDVLVISHGDFDKAPEPVEGQIANPYKYYPIITNRIRDLQQNCYYPCAGPGCASPNPSCCQGQSQAAPGCGF